MDENRSDIEIIAEEALNSETNDDDTIENEEKKSNEYKENFWPALPDQPKGYT